MSSFSQLVLLLKLYLLLFSLQVTQVATASAWKSNCNGRIKILDIAKHQGIETLQYSETSLIILRMAVTQRQEIILINFMKKRTLEFTWQGCKLVHLLWKATIEIPQKVKSITAPQASCLIWELYHEEVNS